MKKLPISIQTFENVIAGDMVYVDKTKFIYQLVNTGKYYESYLDGSRRVLILGIGFLIKQLHGQVEEYFLKGS